MKRLYFSSLGAGLAVALLGGQLALAQPAPPGGMQPPQKQWQQQPQQRQQQQQQQQQQWEHQQQQRQQWQRQHMGPPPSYQPQQHMGQTPRYRPPPRYEARHNWRRGEHFDGRGVAVYDWRYYHLTPPPHGYEWVQDNGQFVLVAIATGIIVEVILNALSH